MDWFRGKEEVAKTTRKQEIAKIEAMDHDDKRQCLREIVGQLFEVVKLNFNGRGARKTLAEELEKEPTEGDIVARFYDTYGGGDYEVWVYKPKRMKFNTIRVDGDPVFPDGQSKGPKDPIDRLMAAGIDNMNPQDKGRLMTAVVSQRLGLPPTPPQSPYGQYQGQGNFDPVLAEKLAMARDLRAQGKYMEAAQVLNGQNIKDRDSLDQELDRLTKLTNTLKNLGMGGGQKSEKAEEYEAIGHASEAVARGFTEGAVKIVEAWTGRPVGDEDDDEGPRGARHEYLCGNCRASLPVKEFDDGSLKNCPKCGILLLRPGQAPPQTPPQTPPAPPQITPPQAPAPTPQPAAPPVAQPPVETDSPAQNLTESEWDFIYKAIPEIFLNRIRALNKEKVPLMFKTIQAKHKWWAPKGAAAFDVDYMFKNYPDRARVTLEMAKVGFEGMVGKYRPYIDRQIDRYEYAASLMRSLGNKEFKKQNGVSNKEMNVLMDYRRLKIAWDYFQQPHALKWWNDYCAEVVIILSKALNEMPPIEGPNTKVIQPEEKEIAEPEKEEMVDADTDEAPEPGTEERPNKPDAPKVTDPQK